jgi:hypothetical protein
MLIHNIAMCDALVVVSNVTPIPSVIIPPSMLKVLNPRNRIFDTTDADRCCVSIRNRFTDIQGTAVFTTLNIVDVRRKKISHWIRRISVRRNQRCNRLDSSQQSVGWRDETSWVLDSTDDRRFIEVDASNLFAQR